MSIYVLSLQAVHTSRADSQLSETRLSVLRLEAEEVQLCASTPLCSPNTADVR